MRAHAELFAYCDSLLSRKQARPDDDVASTLAAARIDGAPMPREMAVMNCHDLIAGNETARHTVSAAVLTVTDKQPFWTALRRRDGRRHRHRGDAAVRDAGEPCAAGARPTSAWVG